MLLCLNKLWCQHDFLLWSRKKVRFAAFAARCWPLSRKPLPPKPQAFRTLAANQKHNSAVPNSQRCCSCFTAVFFPFYFSVFYALLWWYISITGNNGRRRLSSAFVVGSTYLFFFICHYVKMCVFVWPCRKIAVPLQAALWCPCWMFVFVKRLHLRKRGKNFRI